APQVLSRRRGGPRLGRLQLRQLLGSGPTPVWAGSVRAAAPLRPPPVRAAPLRATPVWATPIRTAGTAGLPRPAASGATTRRPSGSARTTLAAAAPYTPGASRSPDTAGPSAHSGRTGSRSAGPRSPEPPRLRLHAEQRARDPAGARRCVGPPTEGPRSGDPARVRSGARRGERLRRVHPRRQVVDGDQRRPARGRGVPGESPGERRALPNHQGRRIHPPGRAAAAPGATPGAPLCGVLRQRPSERHAPLDPPAGALRRTDRLRPRP